jgi:UDP-2,4-diacetamido-2,4,6-trideoxy-beta-L-altropyranose hydrolase
MKVAIRVDASENVGAGHLMRCLTLADELRANGATVIFITHDLAEDWMELITGRGHLSGPLPVRRGFDARAEDGIDAKLGWRVDAMNTRDCLGAFGTPDWLIVDHYALDAKWEACLRPRVGKIMVIDDLADREHDCDLLLDSNFFEGSGQRYDRLIPKECVRLIGPQYALLRPEFRKAFSEHSTDEGEKFRIVVSFGGSDPTGETLKILAAIKGAGLRDTLIDVVVGSWNKDRFEIERMCGEIPGANYLFNVDNMACLMAKAALYVGAGGTTTWERCCMNLPGIVIATAENQIAGSVAMARRGAQIYLGKAPEVSGDNVMHVISFLQNNVWLRDALGNVGAGIVDGLGAERVVRRIIHVGIELRAATPSDSEVVFQWRNSSEVRCNSFNSEPIEWRDHAAWYAAVLSNPNKVLLISMSNGKAVGVLRYDLHDCKGVVSIYLSPESLGKGYGEHVLSAGNDWMAAHYPQITELEAETLPENVASARVFERAGFDLKNFVFRRSQNNVH